MILSKMLGMITENPDLLEDQIFCELVLAAWEDFKSLFDDLYDGELDRDSKLFGWQGQVGNELRNIIQLVSLMSWQPLEDTKSVGRKSAVSSSNSKRASRKKSKRALYSGAYRH